MADLQSIMAALQQQGAPVQPAAPAVASPTGGLLEIMRALSPQDRAQNTPANAQAMAESRDAVTKMLQRQMTRTTSPFQGLNDVATAAQMALMSGGKTPFGAAMEKLDTDRLSKTTQIADTLSKVSQRGGMDPIRLSNVMLRAIKTQADMGNQDAKRVDDKINQTVRLLDPNDALRFQNTIGEDIKELAETLGRVPTPQEISSAIDIHVRRNQYRAKPQGQFLMSPYGDVLFGDRSRGTVQPAYVGGGAAAPPAGGQEPALRTPGTPSLRPPRGTAPPPVMSGVSGQTPLAQPQGRVTPSQAGQQTMKQMERERAAGSFTSIVDATLADIERSGPSAMGPLGWLARIGGAAVEQAGSIGIGQDFQRYMREYSPYLDTVVAKGGESARIKAGVLSIAYMYSKAMDDAGVVNVKELDHAMRLLGEAGGSVEQFRQAVDVLRRAVAIKAGGGGAPSSVGGDLPDPAGIR